MAIETLLQPQSHQPYTIQEEIKANQILLRSRLDGALNLPPPSTASESLPTVPLIDLSTSFSDGSLASKQAVAAQIRSACTSTGFFQISNHGISNAAIDGILHQAKRFFSSLTPEQKDALHFRHSDLFRGYEAGADSYVNPDAELETKEGFNWGYEPSLDPSGGDGKYVELDGHPAGDGPGMKGGRRENIWPAESDLPGFKAAVADYYGQVLSLARHLFGLFALSLGLNEDHFASLVTHPGGIARLLHYPPQTAEVLRNRQEGKLGLGAHTDYECFTLLLTSGSPGLEILFPPSPATNNRPLWRPCPTRPGTLTVNVADFLERWTNGVYKSTIHRVVSRPGLDGQGSEVRYSVPFFFSINYDADVEPLPESAVGVSMFQKMKAGEYVLERLRATVG